MNIKEGEIQYDGTNFLHLTTNEGLSDNTITAIIEDNKGALWFGSLDGGLNRYDGVNFTHYKVEDGLGHSWISSLKEDGKGNIWAANRKGISVLVPNSDQFLSSDNSNIKDYQIFTFGIEDGVKRVDFRLSSVCIDHHNRLHAFSTLCVGIESLAFQSDCHLHQLILT